MRLSDSQYARARFLMVEKYLKAIHDPSVLQAMRNVPRHEFVALSMRHLAYEDVSVPMDNGRTLPRPYVTAHLLQTLELKGFERILEVGLTAGYQTALLAHLTQYVYSMTEDLKIGDTVGNLLGRLGYENITIHAGDVSQGLADMSPFDAIVVNEGVPALPPPLCQQMNDKGGRMLIAVGSTESQMLQLVTRRDNRLTTKYIQNVNFHPMYGRYGFAPPEDKR